MSSPNLPDTSETATPVLPSVSKSSSYLGHRSIAEESLEERSNPDLVDEEEEQLTSSWAKALFGKRTGPPRDPDAIATRRSVFDDPYLAPFYWPKKDYENIHRFDPSARWTYREEKVSGLRTRFTFYHVLTTVKAVLRKVDWRVMVMATVGFSALNLDRNNINQANSTSFLSDLGLTTDGERNNLPISSRCLMK